MQPLASPQRFAVATMALCVLCLSTACATDSAPARAATPPPAPTAPPASAPAPTPGAGPSGAPAVAVVRIVQSIDFSGNRKLSSAQLAQAIGLKVGDVNTKEAVGAAMTRIVDAYKALGSDLSLMVDISLPDATHTAIKFLIDEAGTGGNKGAAPRAGGPGGRMTIPRPPAPETRQ